MIGKAASDIKKFNLPQIKYTEPPTIFEVDYMNWKSPIEITRETISSKIDNDIYTAVVEYGVKVDKDELIKALRYDRNQYEKGYVDGKRVVVRGILKYIDNALHDMAVEYYNAGHPEYFAVCEMVHHKVIRRAEKKYTESEPPND